jgi:tetratricopeptide (TPR) repeat protein
MSQSRFARVGLLVAALGLSASPALLQSAHAQDKKAAAPAAAPQETVRKEMAKLLDGATVKALMDQKKYADVKALLDQADAMPDKTPYETYIINRMRIPVSLNLGEKENLVKLLESAINSGRLDAAEKANFTQAVGTTYFEMKNYPKAIEWFKRYETETGDQKLHNLILRANYLNNDFAAVRDELAKQLAANVKANKPMSADELHLLGSSANKIKDKVVYMDALEALVRWYPTDAYWLDLLSRTRGKDTYSNRFALDVYRLQKVAMTKMEADDYTDMAELALLEGQPTEAKQAMDAASGLGLVKTDKQKKLKAQADKQAADDLKNIAAGEASAKKSKDGRGLVNLGYAYVTMGDFDKGIDLIKQGIAKGGLKNAEDAKLRLGVAQAMANKKEDALATLNTVTGNDGRGDMARYWTLWVNRPYPAKDTPPGEEK